MPSGDESSSSPLGIIWGNVFQFAGGRCESVIWREHATSDQEVHAIGNTIVAAQRARGRDREYVGFISAVVGDIRRIRTLRGHGFTVVREPSEGVHHAHICRDANRDHKLGKNDKAELRQALQQCFGPLTGSQNM